MNRRSVLVAVALSGIMLSACSSASGSGGTGSSSPGTSAGSSPLKVGVICSCSGTFGAAFLPSEQVVEAWAKTVNAGGGLDGQKLQVITEDDGGNPSQSATRFQSLESQGVAAIFDDSLVDEAWTPRLASAKIPVFAGPTSSLNPMIFWAGESVGNAGTGNVTVSLVKASGAKNLALLYCVETVDCSPRSIETAAGAAGLPIVYKGTITATQPSFAAQCLAAKQAGAQALSVGSQPSTIARAAGDCAQQGYDPIYIGSLTAWSPTFAHSPGLDHDTWLSSADYPYFDTSQPQIKALDSAMNTYFPGVLSQAATPSEDVVAGWADGLLLEQAAKAGKTGSGPVTSSDIFSGIYTLKDDTLDGLAPPLSFTRGSDNVVSCWFTARFSAGTYSVGNGGKPTCASS